MDFFIEWKYNKLINRNSDRECICRIHTITRK